MAVAAAKAYGLDPSIFLRQIQQESGFNPNARSGAGAEGIAQFMPATAQGEGVNPWNPQQALMGAAKMDAGNLHKYGSYAQMLSAYNSGKANAYLDPNFAGGQTYRYVKDILGGKTPSVGPSAPAGAGGAGGAPSLGGGPSSLIQQLVLTSLLAPGLNPQGGMPSISDPSALLAMAMQRNALTSGSQAALPQTVSPGSTSMPSAVMRGTKAGGFLSGMSAYKPGRLDQGHDFQTNPGGAIIAPGSGVVTRVASDPGGFGPAYPIVKFTSGPYAGKSIYIGHTFSQLKPGQRFSAGQVLSRTGTQPVGNASVPGWAEIGFAPGGVPGPDGQAPPFP
jgi:hypothetical protein